MKYKSDSLLKGCKVRSVAKGYTQTYRVDYPKTFAFAVKMNIIRILLSQSTHFNWKLQQYDVKNVFLHEDLEEEIYMSIPLDFEREKTTDKVCRLRKALYRLK